MATHHPDIHVDDIFASAGVGVAVNPLYFHDSRHDVVAERALRLHLDCPIHRSAFDTIVQNTFQEACLQLQCPLVEEGRGYFTVIDRPLHISIAGGGGQPGTYAQNQALHPTGGQPVSQTSSAVPRMPRPPFQSWYTPYL